MRLNKRLGRAHSWKVEKHRRYFSIRRMLRVTVDKEHPIKNCRRTYRQDSYWKETTDAFRTAALCNMSCL